MLYIIFILVLISSILIFVLWIKSPGIAEPITNENGQIIKNSISTIEKIKLGEIEQYLIIRGADKTKPIMLYLHGGPGFPEIAFMKKYSQFLEKNFIMVYWEQKGAGKSYFKDTSNKNLNLESLISDTQQLSKVLAKRFKKKKIYLMGHSWGSFLGILTAKKYPELFYAYLGIGQVCNQYLAEKISFEWVKEEALKRNDKKAIKKLNLLNFPTKNANENEWLNYIIAQRDYVTKYGGAIYKFNGIYPEIKNFINAPEYTLNEKINFISASIYSFKSLWHYQIDMNLSRHIKTIDIPVYIFQGLHDYQTPHTVAKEFFNQLKAPKKEFFTFENSAHSPHLEETIKFNAIIKEKIIE
jgi:pimeloyl-ACP methyl ester carboxylesterase